MAKLVKTTIHVNGIEIKQFHQFSLNQGIFAHHTFKLVCPAEVLDDIKSTPLSKSKNLIGTSFKIKIENFEGSATPLQFLGLVTQVEAAKYNGHSGDVIVSGYSPTILMDNAPHCKSWEDKNFQYIASEVINDFPKNLLLSNIQPTFSGNILYAVQYKETAWQFLNRLAATYGEWLLYTGKELSVAPLKSEKAILTYGSNLSHLATSMQLRPGNFSQVAHDYTNTTTYESSPKDIAQLTGLDKELGSYAYTQSDDFFADSPKAYNASFVTNQKELDVMTNKRAAAQASNLVRFNGASTHFGVQLGNTIEVNNNHGSYIIIEVNHSCNGIGNYSNEFIAIPETIKVPPVTNYAEPYAESQSAVVTDNYDAEGMGRIRVRFHWMNQDEKTPWIRMMMPHAGGGKGTFFIPEKKEEVIVAFENNSPTKPYVQGTLYNSKQNNSFSTENNDIKIIQTKSGTKIKMNDAEGSILVEDPSGNTWLMDGKGNINVAAPNDINMTVGKNMNVNIGSNMNVNIGNSLTYNVGNQALFNVFQKMFVNTPILQQLITTYFHTQAGKALINSEDEIKIESKNMHIAGREELFMHSEESAIINSKGKAEMKGQEGNNFTNNPVSYEVVKPKIAAKCLVQFRPKKGWKGEECGFDWMRLGETSTFGDTDYETTVSKQMTTVAPIVAVTDINAFNGNYVTNAALYNTLKNDYTPHVIPWKFKKDSTGNELKDATGNKIPADYFCSWVSLFPKEILAADKKTTKASGFSNTKTKLSLIIEIDEEPDYLEFEDNKNFTITPKRIEVKGKGKGVHTFDDHVTIECLKESKTDQAIVLNAIKKGVAPAPDTKLLAGQFKVWANDATKRKEKEVVIVAVKTSVSGAGIGGTGNTTGQDTLFNKYLRQSLIDLKIHNETLDLSADTNFQPGGNYVTGGGQIVSDYYNSPTMKPAGFISMHTYLANRLLAQVAAADTKNPNKYNGVFIAFYMGENGGLIDNNAFNGLNGYSTNDHKYVVMFPSMNVSTASHEFLHSFHLPHTFTNSEADSDAFCTYKYATTENIMDYSHRISQDRFALWHWQWTKANAAVPAKAAPKAKPPVPPKKVPPKKPSKK
jgi:uncharacterized protein involved in type VI secretion and phage assembly